MSTATTAFPAQFADLEPFAGWALPTERERWALRMSSSMDDMQAFYDVAMERLDEVMDFIDQHPIDNLPAEAQRLMHLYCALVMVSFPIEAWRQPNVPDSGAAAIDCVADFPY